MRNQDICPDHVSCISLVLVTAHHPRCAPDAHNLGDEGPQPQWLARQEMPRTLTHVVVQEGVTLQEKRYEKLEHTLNVFASFSAMMIKVIIHISYVKF